MIVVTGGTGNIGRHVLEELAKTDAAVRVLARDPSRVSDYQDRLDVVAADLDDPATLGPALQGVERLFILAPGPDVPAQDAALIRAAVQAGVRHVVMVSSLGAELGGIAGGRPHLPGEALLRESGLEWTVLHPSEFMTNTAWWRDTILSAGSIFVPSGSGRVGFVDPADIGAVAAKVLTTDGHHGQTYRLTGPEALRTADIAAVLSEVLDRPVQHVDVPAQAFRAGMEQAGMPPFLIDMQVEYYAAVIDGVVDIVSPDVPNLLGRPATDFRSWAQANADAFAPATTNAR
ncbi:MAG: SDR family oxidoreductase [Actinomycetota bacterium]|nr:SDR family oxidoreductase [Actinomycetota bacterium]